MRAATEFSNSSKYKAIFTGSLPYPELSTNMGWGYDMTKVSVPIFMTAGTKSSDSGENKQNLGISPLKYMIENYDNASSAKKVRGRVIDAEHQDILTETDGYMTAWLLYFLQNDSEAGTVFFGDNAEIKTNSRWSDVAVADN